MMHPSRRAMSTPQVHAPDYYQRIRADDLGELRLHHVFTEPDAAVLRAARAAGRPALHAGITEWAGLHGERALSLAWDWAALACGRIRPLLLVGPRTNLRLVDASGYDMPDAAALPCFRTILRRHDWRAPVALLLDELRGRQRGPATYQP